MHDVVRESFMVGRVHYGTSHHYMWCGQSIFQKWIIRLVTLIGYRLLMMNIPKHNLMGYIRAMVALLYNRYVEKQKSWVENLG